MTPRATKTGVVAAAITVLLTAACGSSGSSTATTSPTATSSAVPAPTGSGTRTPEVNPAGDIPDSQAYVVYQGSGLTIKVPEGWARSTVAGGALFVDKYNSVRAVRTSAATRPTVATVRAHEVPAVQALAGYRAGSIRTVVRRSGTAVLLTYQATSAPNAVTGRTVPVAVERYEFWHSGALLTVTLTSPVGADNVDPWRTVTDSVTWK